MHIRSEAEVLTRRWIEAFGEPPPVVDVELMRVLLAELAPLPDAAPAR